MAKRINQLTQTTTLQDTDVFAVDSADEAGNTRKITSSTMKKFMLAQSASAITESTKFEKIHYDNRNYIDSGKYTKSYIATKNCLVFWHIKWDCAGNDGLTLEIIDSKKKLKAEITIMSSFEGNNSGWMNKNGSIQLDEGMGIRFRGANAFNTQIGNQLTYLVATN